MIYSTSVQPTHTEPINPTNKRSHHYYNRLPEHPHANGWMSIQPFICKRVRKQVRIIRGYTMLNVFVVCMCGLIRYYSPRSWIDIYMYMYQCATCLSCWMHFCGFFLCSSFFSSELQEKYLICCCSCLFICVRFQHSLMLCDLELLACCSLQCKRVFVRVTCIVFSNSVSSSVGQRDVGVCGYCTTEYSLIRQCFTSTSAIVTDGCQCWDCIGWYI